MFRGLLEQVAMKSEDTSGDIAQLLEEDMDVMGDTFDTLITPELDRAPVVDDEPGEVHDDSILAAVASEVAADAVEDAIDVTGVASDDDAIDIGGADPDAVDDSVLADDDEISGDDDILGDLGGDLGDDIDPDDLLGGAFDDDDKLVLDDAAGEIGDITDVDDMLEGLINGIDSGDLMTEKISDKVKGVLKKVAIAGAVVAGGLTLAAVSKKATRKKSNTDFGTPSEKKRSVEEWGKAFENILTKLKDEVPEETRNKAKGIFGAVEFTLTQNDKSVKVEPCVYVLTSDWYRVGATMSEMTVATRYFEEEDLEIMKKHGKMTYDNYKGPSVSYEDSNA